MSLSAALAPGSGGPGAPALAWGVSGPGAGRICRPQAAVVSCVWKGSVPSREGWVATSGGPCRALVLTSSIRAHSPRSLR